MTRRLAVAGATAALVGAVGAAVLLARGGDEPSRPHDARAQPRLDIERVARRVERLRGLRFDRLPRLVVVDAREMRRVSASLSRAVEPREDRAERIALTQTAMVDPDSVDAVRALAYEPLGMFSPGRPDRVYLLGEMLRHDPSEAEVVLVHELVHALEHQNMGLGDAEIRVFDDRGMAKLSVGEGSATLVEAMYRIRHGGYAGPVGDVLRIPERIGAHAPAAVTLYAFPYTAGARYVHALKRRGGWRAIANAHRRPPRSTAEVLGARPLRRPGGSVRLPRLRAPWRLLARGDFGAAVTYALTVVRGGHGELLGGHEIARRVRAGRIAVWTRGSERCPLPCRDRAVTAISLRVAGARAARTLRRSLESALGELGHVRRAGARRLRIDDGSAAFALRGSRLALVFAPSGSAAERLAQASARR